MLRRIAPIDRRLFLRYGAAASSAMFVPALYSPGVFADELTQTPGMTEGPFYPDQMPLDTDNDLLIIGDQINPSVGEVTHLTGRVLSPAGEPVRNALVEIWQCDSNGAYLHSRSGNGEKRDGNFQGYGRFLTDSKGHYYFRTIKPVPYPGRTPHIHFAVSKGQKRLLTTQMLINGHPQNERDGVFRDITDPKIRQTVLVDFNPLEKSTIGELAAHFEMVLGTTPEDTTHG